MKFKSHAILMDLKPQTVAAMLIANDIWHQFFGEIEFVITSVNDAKHMPTSLHYSGYAFDIRTRTLTNEQIDLAVTQLKESLTIEFDIIKEKDHIHVEYDTKKNIVS